MSIEYFQKVIHAVINGYGMKRDFEKGTITRAEFKIPSLRLVIEKSKAGWAVAYYHVQNAQAPAFFIFDNDWNPIALQFRGKTSNKQNDPDFDKMAPVTLFAWAKGIKDFSKTTAKVEVS